MVNGLAAKINASCPAQPYVGAVERDAC